MTAHDSLSGVHVQRRALLALPVLAAAGARSWGAQDTQQGSAEEQSMAFDAFATRCEGLAEAHLGGGRVDPEVYLHRLAALGARLDPASTLQLEAEPWSDFVPPIRVAPVHRSLPVMVIQWRLDPHAVLPPHNHTPGYVVSLCLEGEARVRHFEIDGAAPAPGEEGAFRLRETQAVLLRPGRSTSLTPDRDNIHTFEAGPKGAMGLDINTILPGDGDWSMIEAARADPRGYDRIYDSRWIGKPR